MRTRRWSYVSGWSWIAATALLTAPAEAGPQGSITSVTFVPLVQKETGGSVTVSVSGQRPANASALVGAALSLSAQGNPLSPPVGCKVDVPATPPSTIFGASCKIALPQDLAPGSYYVVGAAVIGSTEVKMAAAKQLFYR